MGGQLLWMAVILGLYLVVVNEPTFVLNYELLIQPLALFAFDNSDSGNFRPLLPLLRSQVTKIYFLVNKIAPPAPSPLHPNHPRLA